MSNYDKVKNYLMDLGHDVTNESEEDQILVITDEDKGIANMLLDCEGSVLILEQHIFDVDEAKTETYKRLLQINREVIHGAFVLDEEGRRVIFRDTLELDNLDVNELESSINSLAMALAENADEFIGLANRS